MGLLVGTIRTALGYGLVSALAAAPAFAQPASQFFQGKTITIAVGAAAGGGLDTYARLLARHLTSRIPGASNVVVSNMPGAGGQIVARHLMFRAPKDGTTIGTFFPSVLIDALLAPGANALDASKFSFIGNAKVEASVCMLRNDASVKKIEDLLTQDITIGGTTRGSQVVDFPTVERNLLGVKFKLIPGYQGTREVGGAIEKNEVQGICGIGWSTLKVQYPDLLTGNSFARIFVQEDMKGDPELNAAGVPLMPALAKTDIQRQVLTILYAQNDLSRPYVAPPEVPADRLEILQKAFLDALASSELKADADKMRIDVSGLSGMDMRAYVQRLYAAPPEVLKALGSAFGQ
ncbi:MULTISPECIES: tripartite tricarboxylate transporter substrate-binding protein [unclassified Beijerinckia]|uniref:tripartite tricarboxylate transporter substrate-binding protein n=1 Tax=unclassified Beijerinckia TaxID=2638183 RepID=UPI00089CB0D3|nr:MULTISPECIES: tripartite tricarboxylate transporter substrate-binding protein [unclassified Beijerinckia]MDH7794813.1 tripartite-type tricarboxylate transporter receptor subunit TctC [Beijerinckia sp. GAS462]SEB76182.1 Tripartite-type tricarboxylate transporter, receptor component TctC [Beijerinckia sp. 28-YEA-48]